MLTKTLSYYCSKFENLRRDFKNGGAPHKPILLISLIQAYQNGLYTTSKFKFCRNWLGCLNPTGNRWWRPITSAFLRFLFTTWVLNPFGN